MTNIKILHHVDYHNGRPKEGASRLTCVTKETYIKKGIKKNTGCATYEEMKRLTANRIAWSGVTNQTIERLMTKEEAEHVHWYYLLINKNYIHLIQK